MKTNEQTFKNFYKVAYLSNEFNQIELSINNILFTLENDLECDCCNVYDTFSGVLLDEIVCLQFDANLLASEYPNSTILEYIVTNLID